MSSVGTNGLPSNCLSACLSLQFSALSTTSRSRCVKMPLCLCSVSSCGFKPAHPAGRKRERLQMSFSGMIVGDTLLPKIRFLTC